MKQNTSKQQTWIRRISMTLAALSLMTVLAAAPAMAAERKVIGSTKAKQIALKRAGGKGRVVKCHLEYDDGTRVYDIEIRNGRHEYEIEINAYSGKVREYDHEYEDDHYDHD